MFKKLDNRELKIYRDERGMVYDFSHKTIKNLHVVSIKPGTERGNHSHKMAEIICVINGNNRCEIELRDNLTRMSKKISIQDDIEVYKIDADIHHIVKNIGDSVFQLVCFNECLVIKK